MNTFAGSLTFEWTVPIPKLPFHSVVNETLLGTNIFVYGETEFASSKDLTDFVQGIVTAKLVARDISIKTEDTIELIDTQPVEWRYHFVAFHGRNFNEVYGEMQRLHGHVVAVREAEESDKLWGKVIKVDMVDHW